MRVIRGEGLRGEPPSLNNEAEGDDDDPVPVVGSVTADIPLDGPRTMMVGVTTKFNADDEPSPLSPIPPLSISSTTIEGLENPTPEAVAVTGT